MDDKGKEIALDANMESNNPKDGINVEEEGNDDLEEVEAPKAIEKPLNELTAKDILCMKFESLSEAESFYYKYAKMVGFIVRKDHIGRDKKGDIVWRQYVCACEGLRVSKIIERKRQPKLTTRTNCKALFKVHIGDDSRWYVSVFVEEHNHELAGCQHVHLVRSYRAMNYVDFAQARTTGVASMGVSSEHMAGSETVGFTERDQHNIIDGDQCRKIISMDAEVALSYLRGKLDSDPMFYLKYSLQCDGYLQNLFWADGHSRVDYEIFGDVVALNTTYKKNTYNKPIVIIIGVNHHHQTIVYGCAVLLDESVESYCWVLQTLLECMQEKKPKSIVTDGDFAIIEAISKIFPECNHRLCLWHLEENARTNVGDSNFMNDFGKLMSDVDVEEAFEDQWASLVRKYDLQNNAWVNDIYQRKHLWASAYLRGKFFADLKTTLCEGINEYLGRFLESKYSFVEFLHHFQRSLKQFRSNENEADLKSNQEVICTSSVRPIEKHASTVFTWEVFRLFREELECSGYYLFEEKIDQPPHRIYRFCQYSQPELTRQIIYDTSNSSIRCSCMKFESVGLPCSHMICVMKYEHMQEIPQLCFLARWTKNAKSLGHVDIKDKSDSQLFNVRYTMLQFESSRMNYFAAYSRKTFGDARRKIMKLTRQFEMSYSAKKSIVEPPVFDKFGNLEVINTNGQPGSTVCGKRKQRCCGICRGPGHSRRHCPMFHQGPLAAEVDSSSSSSDDEQVVNPAPWPHPSGGD